MSNDKNNIHSIHKNHKRLHDRSHSYSEHAGPLLPMLDITAPMFGCAVEISDDNKTLWVHVDGQTVLRVCRVPEGGVINT